MKFPVPDMDEVHSKLQAVYLGDEAPEDQMEAAKQSMQGNLVQSLRGGVDQIGIDMLIQVSVECPHCQEWVAVRRVLRHGDFSTSSSSKITMQLASYIITLATN